jgi:hypothetical protein
LRAWGRVAREVVGGWMGGRAKACFRPQAEVENVSLQVFSGNLILNKLGLGAVTMKYQDLKIRDAGRLGLIGVGLALAVIICIGFRATVEPMMGRRYWSIVGAMAFMCPLVLVVAVWYLISSPEGDAKFLKWAERNLRQKPGPKFDPTLLDPADPNYSISTLSYWMAKRRGRLS